ncbi:MAG: hypothetical protein WCM76_09590 [Bacteroidota bacterium]
MKLKSISFSLILILLFLGSCKLDQDLHAPTVFNLTVADEYTNEPLSGCRIILHHHKCAGCDDTCTLGYTDAGGQFQYTFDTQPSEVNTYALSFTKPEYFDVSWGLALTNKTTDELIKMSKKTTLGVKIRRITPPIGCPPETYFLVYSVYQDGSWDISTSFQTDTVSPTIYHYRYYNIRAKTTYTTTWFNHLESSCTGIVNSARSYGTLTTGYNDTTYFNLDY